MDSTSNEMGRTRACAALVSLFLVLLPGFVRAHKVRNLHVSQPSRGTLSVTDYTCPHAEPTYSPTVDFSNRRYSDGLAPRYPYSTPVSTRTGLGIPPKAPLWRVSKASAGRYSCMTKEVGRWRQQLEDTGPVDSPEAMGSGEGLTNNY